MTGKKALQLSIGFLVLGVFLLYAVKSAQAVPSFKRQTGMNCSVCHTVFPQLTQFGRMFKLDGYVMSNKSAKSPWIPPLAGMFKASYTQLNQNDGILTDGVAPWDSADSSMTDKTNIPQEAALYYAGRIVDHIGAFTHVMYSGTENDLALDLTDIRYSLPVNLGQGHLVWGLTINNAPSVQDLWNTTPIWGFPFVDSDVAPTPAATTLIDGTLAQQVGGLGTYGAYYIAGTMIYGGFSVYSTTDSGIARPLGAGTTVDTVTDGAVPYWRLAAQKQWGRHSLELGTYGLVANVYPDPDNTNGPTDKYTDYAFDAQYEFMGRPHLLTLRTTWIHETQDLDASHAQGLAANSSNDLETFKINGSYHYQAGFGFLGGSVGYFTTTGDSDPGLYSPDPVDGSASGSPDSSGFILQADYTWREQYKIALQYTIYDQFNGASSDYDGFGRDASDNNTLYVVAWLMF